MALNLDELGITPAGLDAVRPFAVEGLDVRGRAVALGPVLQQILDRHDYPEPVSRLLAEAIVLTGLLGTSLKFEGRFTLQTQTEGPVSMIVVDFASPDAIRACAAGTSMLRPAKRVSSVRPSCGVSGCSGKCR